MQDFCLDLWVVLCIFFAFAFAFAKKELPYVWAAVEKGNIIIIYSNIKYNNNKVETVIVNTKITNLIMAKASELIDILLDNKYIEKELNTIKVPLGTFISNSLFSSFGPLITIHLKPLGAYNADIYTNISSYGINNSLIEVYLDVVIDIVALIPLQKQNIKISSKIYLISQIIQGSIPNYYYGNGANIDYIPDND